MTGNGRVGCALTTPAITTRGFKETETKILGNLICDVLENMDNEAEIKKINDKILNLCSQFPVYSSRKQPEAYRNLCVAHFVIQQNQNSLSCLSMNTFIHLTE